ncbi:MAG: helix-turn-helix transcriptional regulator [Myxococcota bacterium]
MLNRGVLSEDDAGELLPLLRKATATDAVIIGQEWGLFGGFFRTEGVPEAWPAVYGRLQHQDPGREYLAARPFGAWYLIVEDSTPEQLDSELHRAFLKHGFIDGAITLLPAAGSPVALVLYRRQGSKSFDARDRTHLELLYPHLRRAFARARSARAWSGEVAGERTELLRGTPHVRIAYPSGKIEWSAAARRLFEERLAIAFDKQQQRLESMVRLAAAADVGTPVPLVADLVGEVLLVADDMGKAVEAVVLLQQVDAPAGGEAPLAPAEALLSPRQRRVARLAASGRSLREVGEDLGMSTETARSHLKAVYERLGITERTTLSHLLR